MAGPDTEADLVTALAVADIADRIARQRFGASDLAVDEKPDGSPVCDADRAIESAVVEVLAAADPALPTFGSERGPAYDGSPSYWAIDPIDGTAAFIAGTPGWGFLVALVRDHEPTVAVASSIGLGRRWWASTGHGAFARALPDGAPTRLHVSSCDDLATASIGWWDGWRTEAADRTSPLAAVVQTLEAIAGSVIAHGAAALSVAGGELDAAIMRNPNAEPHHASAFILLAREAGGLATTMPSDNTVLFSNFHLHERLLELLHAP